MEERRSKNRAELGIEMLQELERHVEGEKRSKGNKSIVEIRRGMLHSQLIGEQMRGAQKLEGRHNTKDENNKANRRRKTRKGKGKI